MLDAYNVRRDECVDEALDDFDCMLVSENAAEVFRILLNNQVVEGRLFKSANRAVVQVFFLNCQLYLRDQGRKATLCGVKLGRRRFDFVIAEDKLDSIGVLSDLVIQRLIVKAA